MSNDQIGAFSTIPDNVVCKEYLFSYIHVPLEEYDRRKLRDFKRTHRVDGA